MKKSNLISDTKESIKALIKVVRTPIDEGVKPERMKGVLEGRHLSFTIAHSQINQLKDFELKDTIFDSDEHKRRIEELIRASDALLPEISKVLRADIELVESVEDEDGEYDERSKDEKFKSIVMSKKVALDFYTEIVNTQDSLKFKLENDSGQTARKNLATARVKRNL